MRFVFVPFVILASITFATAQTVSIDPTVAAPEPAVTKTPPPPASVNVLNFPEVQAVEGTVAVSNLPAVQTVGGTVNVGNLPLDADGAVRVTTAAARQVVWYELLAEPIVYSSGTNTSVLLPTAIDTTGYKSIAVLVRGTQADTGSSAQSFEVRRRWSDDEDFLATFDQRGGGQYGGAWLNCSGLLNARYVCPNWDGSVKIALSYFASGTPDPLTISSVRVYLIP
jgi:hypothetical protein